MIYTYIIIYVAMMCAAFVGGYIIADIVNKKRIEKAIDYDFFKKAMRDANYSIDDQIAGLSCILAVHNRLTNRSKKCQTFHILSKHM